MSGPNDNGQPAHMQSQQVPPGNHTTAAPPLEKQLLALQQRERALQKREAEIKNMVSLDSLKERAKADRAGLLKELGMEDLAPQPDPNDPMASMKKQLQDLQDKLANDARQKEEQAYFDSIRSGLREKGDEYELLDKLGMYDSLFDNIRSHAAQHNEMPDHFEFAKQMQANLIDGIKKALGTKAMAPILQEFMPKPQSNTTKHPLDSSNTFNSGSHSQQSTQPAQRSLTHAEQIQEAAKLIKFNTQQQG